MHHKFLLLAVILIVAGILVALFWQFQAIPAPELANTTVNQQQSSSDTSSTEGGLDSAADISAEVDAIDIGDLDAEFQTIDTDINSL